MGQALSVLRSMHHRNSYILITKCGRKSFDTFDYSSSWIRYSITRSLDRLRTGYLDVALLHDAEFTSEDEILDGVTELATLRSEGLIRSFGLSGYTLSTLLSHFQAIQSRLGLAAEVFFSYANYNLQNQLLVEYAPQLRAAGVKHIINGSPLSMGLLRAESPPDWHPGSTGLKAACQKASKHAESAYGQKLTDVASRFAMGFAGTTCCGASSMEELEAALAAWETVKTRRETGTGDGDDRMVFQDLQNILRGNHETTWPSPPPGFVRRPIEKDVSVDSNE